MSQYYPPQPGYYPPPPNPEGGYYEDDNYEAYEMDEGSERQGDSWFTRLAIFMAGGCLTFILMASCGGLIAVLWILDPGSSLLAPSVAGSDIGLTSDDPARITEEVVNDKKISLSILDINPNAESNTIPQTEGSEILIVTVELKNLSEEIISYDDEFNFKLLNQGDGFYDPTPGAIDGALGFGDLQPLEGQQGRLVFQILAEESGLMLEWQMPDSEPRYIALQ